MMRNNFIIIFFSVFFFSFFELFSQTANNDSYVHGVNGVDLQEEPVGKRTLNGDVSTNDVGFAGTDVYELLVAPNGGTLSCQTGGDPNNGQNNKICTDGTFRFVHNGGEVHNNGWIYKIVKDGVTYTGSVTITTNSVNDAPEPLPDAIINLAEGSVTNIDLSVNDGDDDNPKAQLTWALAQAQFSKGTISSFDAANGTLTYTAPAALIATFDETMNYTLTDGALTTQSTFRVQVVNTPPVPQNDEYTVNVGTPLVIAAPGPLANDPGTNAKQMVWQNDGPDHGNLACDVVGDAYKDLPWFCQNGKFTYTFTGNNQLTDEFTYKLFDGEENSNVNATVTININHCPVGGTGDVYEVIEGGTLNVATAAGVGGGVILGTVGDVPGTGANRGKKTAGTADSDINNGDVLKAVLSGAPPAHAQSFTLNQNGTFTYVHDGTNAVAPNHQVTFQYTLHDGPVPYNANNNPSGCPPQGPYTVTINIIPQNDCPDCTDDTYTIPEGFAMNVPVGSGFIQGDANDNAKNYTNRKTAGGPDTDEENNTLSAVKTSDPTGFVPGTWVFNAAGDGRFTYTHNMDPNVGAVVNTTSFKYRIGDDGADPNCPPAAGEECTVTIVIQNVAPVVDNDDFACGTVNAVKEGGVVNVAAPGVLDGDVFNNPFDPKTFVITDAPDFGTLLCAKVGDPNEGQNNFCSDGSFRYTHACNPGNDANNVETIKYRINDGTDNSNEATVTICIENECPVGEDDFYSLLIDDGGTLNATGGGGLFEGVLTLNDGNDDGADGIFVDTDPNNCDNLTATYKAGNGPSNGTLTCPTNVGLGAPAICPDGTFRYVHNAGQGVNDTFDYVLNDGECQVNVSQVTISVNACPTGQADTYSVNEGQFININTAAGAGGGVILGTVGGSKTGGAADTDPNGTPLTIASAGINNRGIKTAPTKGTIVCEKGGDPNLGAAPSICSDGTFKYTHNGDEPGAGVDDFFEYILTDGTCQVDVRVDLNVNPQNDCPVGTADTYEVNEGQTLDINTKAGAGGGVILGTVGGAKSAGAADSDVDSNDNTLTAALSGGGPSHGVLTCPTNVGLGTPAICTDGTFRYVHDGGAAVTDSFQYTLNDGDGCNNAGPFTVTINITQTNDCPAGNNDTYTVNEGGTLVLDDHDGTANADPNDNGIKANDVGDEESDKYVLGWELVSAPSNGVIQNQTANGELQYVHNGLNTNADTFTYRYIDAGCTGGGFSPAITVTINITPIDNCPVARPDSYIDIINEGGTLVRNAAQGVIQWNTPSADDSDIEGDAFIVEIKPGSGPFRGTLTCPSQPGLGSPAICPDGSFNYTHDGSENLDDQFSYYARDNVAPFCADGGPNNRTEAAVSIRVVAQNDCPIAIDDAYTVNENETINADGQGVNPEGVIQKENTNLANAKDSDAENDAFTVALKAGAANAPVNGTLSCPTNVGLGTPAICPDGTFRYVHDGSETISDQFTYVITPGVACVVPGDNEGVVNITIIPQPDCPIVVNEAETVVEGGTLTGNNCAGGTPCDLSKNDDAGGGTKNYTITQQPTQGAINIDPLTGVFTYVHNGNETPGTDVVKYTTNNGQCDSNEGTLNITITPANDPPEALPDIYNCNEGGNININTFNTGVLNNDDDPDFTPPGNPFKDDPLKVHQVVKQPDKYDAVAAGQAFTVNQNGTFIYFHDGSAGATDTFTYTARDDNCLATNNCPTTTVTINIVAVNDCPIGEDDNYTVNEGELLSANGLAGNPEGVILRNDGSDSGNDGVLFDFDEENDQIIVTQVGPDPLHGIFNLFPNGTFNYTHNGTENFNGISFQYNLTDNAGCNVAAGGPYTVNITVIPVNECPVVDDHTYGGVNEGESFTVAAPAGVSQGAVPDVDPDGDNLTAVVIANPSHGVLTCPATLQAGICQDGAFKYQHDGSENHTDTFTYGQNDGNGCTRNGTVTINITPVNDPPVANDDLTYSVNEGQTLNISDINLGVRANDSDPEQDVMDVNQVTLDWGCGGCSGPSQANNWVANPDGTFTYTHNGTDLVNVDEIKYQLDDNQAANNKSNIATVRINIINTPPVANGENYTVDKCETILANDLNGSNALIADGVLVNDTDVDPEDQLKLTAIINTATTHGVLSCTKGGDPNNGKINNICTDGSFQYVHDGTPNPTTDSFTYFVNDGEVSTADPVTATITIINRAPVGVLDEYTILEGQTLTVTAGALGLKDNDTDANSCDNLVVTMKTPPKYHNENSNVVVNPNDPCLNNNNVNCPQGGPFEAQTDGAFTYVHDGSETTIDSLMYRVSDGDLTAPATKAIINITPVNDPPTARNDTFYINECETIVIDAANGLKKNDEDPDNDISLVEVFVPATDVPTKGILSCGFLNNTACRDGSFQYVHNGDDKPNVDSFKYRLWDGEDFSATLATVTIIINNRVPPGAQNETYSVNECKTIIVDAASGVLANDADPDCKDVMRIIMKDLPTMGAFIPKEDGSFTYSHDCTDNPDNTFFTYFITDGEDTTTVADTAFININNVCVVGNDDLYENILEGGKLIINADSGVLHNDNDQNPLDPVTVVPPIPLTSPQYGVLNLFANGSFDYVHDDSENFEDVFTYLVNDGECVLPDTVTVTIRITPVPDTPPVALGDTYDCIDEDSVLQTLTYLEGVLGNDYDLDEKDSVLTAVLVTLPLHGSLILNPNGTFIYNHNGSETTADSFTYFATDGDFNTDTVTVNLCINPVNDCPVPVADIYNINEGQTIDSSLVANDSDIEITNGITNNELVVSVLDEPKNVDGDIVGNLYWSPDGKFVYNPPRHIEAPGPEVVTFDYALSDDGFVLCDSTTTVTITIAHINDCPVAVNDSIEFDASSPITITKDLIVNDFDIDSDIDSTSIEIIRNPDFGEVIVNNDGTITYNFDNSPTNFDTLIYTVRDIEGCPSNQGYMFIHAKNLNPTIYELPNYFTPNDDLFNDYFVAKYQNIKEEYIGFNVKIYDRYERIVYTNDDVSTDKVWDGRNNSGQPVQSDFYYFEVTPVEYKGTKYERTKDIIAGTVYLERER